MSTPETQTQTLTEFLLARIEEEQADAIRCQTLGVEHPLSEFAGWVEIGSQEKDVAEDLLSRYTTARVLAECAAKRRIVELLEYDGSPEAWLTLRALASVYADHEDYRQEWK